jgi:hypothetical protein
MEIKFRTEASISLDRDLTEHEKYALLDWVVGECTPEELRHWLKHSRHADTVAIQQKANQDD